jgi:hypothetical protein
VKDSPPRKSRLEEFLQAGSNELEATLADSTDLSERVCDALEKTVSEGYSSRLNGLLQAGDADLQETLAESIDIEERLAETLGRMASEGSGPTLLPMFIEHNLA